MTEYSPRIETLLETGQVTYDDAERMSGRVPDGARVMGGKAVEAVQEPKKKAPRYSRRGGRSFPEPSDSELDPHWNTGYTPLSDTQAEVNRKGIDLMRATVEFTKSDAYLALPSEERDSAIERFVTTYQEAQYQAERSADA